VELFNSPNLPDRIAGIYLTNVTAFQNVARVRPANSFELNLDFSKPPLLDGKNLVSSPTPNLSHFAIQGDRDAWVASISDAVMGVVQNRRNKRTWLHRAFVYDLGLLLIGLPSAIYACWKSSTLIERYLESTSSFLSVSAYVYVVLSVVWAYRLFFGYTKWAFPSVELTEAKDAARKHRAFWYLLMIGLLVNALWEIFARS
jgi:hypothetical protein